MPQRKQNLQIRQDEDEIGFSNSNTKKLRVYEMNPKDAIGKDRRRIQKAVNTKKFHDKNKTEANNLRKRVDTLEKDNRQLRQDNEQLLIKLQHLQEKNEKLEKERDSPAGHSLNEDSGQFCLETSLELGLESLAVKQREYAPPQMNQDEKQRTETFTEMKIVHQQGQNAKKKKDPFWPCPLNDDAEDHSMFNFEEMWDEQSILLI